jgi:hypothetical protein
MAGDADPGGDEPPTLRLKNEFASVSVEIDERGNGKRLAIRDLKTGQSILLDPLELASLTRYRHAELAVFMDPSRDYAANVEDQALSDGLSSVLAGLRPGPTGDARSIS